MSNFRRVQFRQKNEATTKLKPVNRPLSLQTKQAGQITTRSNSVGGLEELVQCGICLEKLNDPRMLPCQHTFCLSCLQSFVTSQIRKSIIVEETSSPNSATMNCPMCQQAIILEKGLDSVLELPKNLQTEMLMKLLEGESPSSPKPDDVRCSKCQIITEGNQNRCQHCRKIFCNICWNGHISELESNLASLSKQLQSSGNTLNHKIENYENRCDSLKEAVKEAAAQKINELLKLEEDTLQAIESMKNEAIISGENIREDMLRLKTKLEPGVLGNGNKVANFMSLHAETSKLLRAVHSYGEARVIFDPETFKLDQDTEGIYNDEENKESTNDAQTSAYPPNENEMYLRYKSATYVPKLKWTKCPRPGGVAIPPWDNTKLYMAATDSHSVLILDREKMKLVNRLVVPEMLCPVNVTFSMNRKEIYISDKWNHCIHVFSSKGEHLKCLGGKGRLRNPSGIDMTASDELVIADSANDRIVIMDPENGMQISVIGIIKGKITLNTPMDVAVSGDNIVVADTGKHRIKTFNMEGEKLNEFGSMGRHKGQFRSAEVVAVDSHGFILVGDAGNARIQVFTKEGTLVKIIGSKEGFSWISGICVSQDLDVIVTDGKSRCLTIY